jgi:heptosyltransferase III
MISPDSANRATRVLIINVTRIGDTLLATPAIRAIAHYFPNADITVLGHPKRVEVLEHIPHISKVGSITKQNAWRRGWKDAWATPEYDYAFVWGQDAALVRYALRKARQVVAEAQHSAHAGRDAAINARVAFAFDAPVQNSIHAVAWFLAMVNAVGIPTRGHTLDYYVTEQERQAARTRMALTMGATNFLPTVGFQVASFATKAWRDWPIQRFIDLGLRIVQQYPDARFVCFGAKEDAARIAELERSLRGRVVNFAGTTSLRESVALMSLLDVYVGIDTGPTHLYSALLKPMVVLYHPTIPSALYKPLKHPALSAIDHPLASPTCRTLISMNEIDGDTVWRAVERAIDSEPSEWPGMPSPGIDVGVAPWPGDALPYK